MPKRPDRSVAFSFISPLTLLLVWEIGSRTGLFDRRVLPPPSAVLALLWEMARGGMLWPHVEYTLARFVAGTILGVVPGVLLGLTMGIFPWCRAVLQPIIAILYPLPRIALFPLLLIIVGLNETSNVLMVALGPFFTMV